MELWDVYDKDGNKLDKTIQRGDALPRNEFHKVVHIWLKNKEGNYLIQQRAACKDLPLLWANTGGAVIHNEEPLQAAIREVYEELGVTLNPNDAILLSEEKVTSPRNPFFLYVYLFPCDVKIEDLHLDPMEVHAAQYVSLETIRDMTMKQTFMGPIAHLRLLQPEPMELPKMVLFDFWDTLILYHLDAKKGDQALLDSATSNPLQVTPEQFEQKARELLHDIHQEGDLEIHNYDFQSYLFEYFQIKSPLTPMQREKVFVEAGYTIELVPGIREFLTFLKRNKIRIAILSNTIMNVRTLRRILRKHLPGFRFEFVLASSQYLFKKPHRRFFEVAIHKSGLDPKDILFIGDTFEADILGANQVGMPCVWLNHKGKTRLYDHMLDYIRVTSYASLQGYFNHVK